jgi:hypothetical protein
MPLYPSRWGSKPYQHVTVRREPAGNGDPSEGWLMMHEPMKLSEQTANVSKKNRRPKYRPGRLGQNVDHSLRLVASWPVQDRRSVEVRRPGPHGASAGDHSQRT